MTWEIELGKWLVTKGGWLHSQRVYYRIHLTRTQLACQQCHPWTLPQYLPQRVEYCCWSYCNNLPFPHFSALSAPNSKSLADLRSASEADVSCRRQDSKRGIPQTSKRFNVPNIPHLWNKVLYQGLICQPKYSVVWQFFFTANVNSFKETLKHPV